MDAWDRTAHVLWMQAEVNRDKSKRPQPFTVADFHPGANAEERSSTKIPLTQDVFRARAIAWFKKKGLPVPAKLLSD
jgi:hypothetical protein